MITKEFLIRKFNFIPLPVEGGYYARFYTSSEIISREFLPNRYTAEKRLMSGIYYLLTPEFNCSRMHRLITDETANHLLGDPVTSLFLYPDGSHKTVTMGQNLEAGHSFFNVLPKGVWQGHLLQPGGEFALMSGIMSPGWDDSDFELGDRKLLQAAYPEVVDLIERLTVKDPHTLIAASPGTGMTRIQEG